MPKRKQLEDVEMDDDEMELELAVKKLQVDLFLFVFKKYFEYQDKKRKEQLKRNSEIEKRAKQIIESIKANSTKSGDLIYCVKKLTSSSDDNQNCI